MTEEIHRTLGEHTADIRTLKEDVKEVKDDVKSILQIISETKGGWKLLVIIATSASGATVMLQKFIATLSWLPK